MKFFKYFLPLLILMLLFSCHTGSQAPEAESIVQTDTEKEHSTFLWKAEKDGKTNYLLGSIHLGTEDLYPLHEIIEESFAKSDVLVLEADIGGASQSDIMKLVQEIGYYKDGETLKDNISEENYEFIYNSLKERNYDLSSFENFKPWLLSMTITPFEMMKLGFSPAHGIDMYFYNKAKERSMEIKELEGIEYQLRLFDSFPADLQEMFLVNSIMELDALKEGMDSMLEMWKTGDADNLFNYLYDSIEQKPEMEEFYRVLNDERNFEMVEKIDEMFQDEKTYFIVVGALHLLGENGIINLLEQRGYDTSNLPS